MVYNWESDEVDAVVVTDGSRNPPPPATLRIYDRLFYFCLFLMLLIYVCVVFVSLDRLFHKRRVTSCVFLMVEIVM